MAQIQNDPKNSKKPQNIIEKMVTGRIGKFYENNASCSRRSLRTATSPLSSTLLRKQRRPAAR